MKTAKLKAQEFEWISFHEFIEEIKKIVPKDAWVSKTMPWSGRFHEHIFTHENDGLYLIGHAGYDQVRFHKEDVLCFTKNNRPFTLKHPLVDFIDNRTPNPTDLSSLQSKEQEAEPDGWKTAEPDGWMYDGDFYGSPELSEYLISFQEKIVTGKPFYFASQSPAVQVQEVISEVESFEMLFKAHQEFSINKFPNSTAESSLIGLKREADEAIQELHGINRDYDGKALPLEYVDCFMYLIDSIQRAGISLEQIKESFIDKLAINEKRKWNQNVDGSYSHVKQDTDKQEVTDKTAEERKVEIYGGSRQSKTFASQSVTSISDEAIKKLSKETKK
jgi:hypothetical protein